MKNIGTKRNLEAFLLIIALAIGVLGYVIVTVNRTQQIPANLALHLLALIAMAFVVHFLVRKFAPYADPVILPLAIALNGIGLTMIYRLDFSYKALGLDGFVVNHKQLMWSFLGVVACCLVFIGLPDHKWLRRFTYSSGLLAIVLLLLPMVPGLGENIYGARIWIKVGPFSFQPSELAKICLAIFFAGYFTQTRDKLALAGPKFLGIRWPRIRDFAPLLVAWGASIAVLVLQRDLGTSLLIFGLFVAQLYIATDRLSWIMIGLALFIPAAVVAAQIFPHVGARFDIWWNAFDPAIYNKDPGGSGQLVSGLFGLANGGLTGTGWGKGYPQLVPFANSDFIIASLGEELGLTGFIAIICMYLLFVSRGLKASEVLRDDFGKLLTSGLSFIVCLQVFVIVGGVTRLIPLTGLTTPFLSAGGSSLVSNWIILGLLIRLTDSARRTALFDKEAIVMDYEPAAKVVTVKGSSKSELNTNYQPKWLRKNFSAQDIDGVTMPSSTDTAEDESNYDDSSKTVVTRTIDHIDEQDDRQVQ